MDPEVHALTAEQARVGEVFDAMPRSMVLGITPEYIHTLQAAAKHPRIFRDLVDPILDGIQNLPHKPPLRTPSEIEGCKDQDSIAATMLLWLASHEGKVSDMGKATGDFLREFTTNLLNWRRELMKASTTGRAYLGARGPDIATIAFPETEVEGVQGVQALVEQATAATGPAGAAPPEERLAPMLSPREEILAASASVMDAARVAQDSHSETPLPHASVSTSEQAQGAGQLDGACEAEEADEAGLGLDTADAEGRAAGAAVGDGPAEGGEAEGAAEVAAAEASAGQPAAQAGAMSASSGSTQPFLRAALLGMQTAESSQPGDDDSTPAAPPTAAPPADVSPAEAPEPTTAAPATAATAAAAPSATSGLVVDTSAEQPSSPLAAPGTPVDSSRGSRGSGTSSGGSDSGASPASGSRGGGAAAAAAAAASPMSASPAAAPSTPQLLSPQRTIPTTPRTAAKAAALEGKARHVRRAVSFSEKAISHSNDAATRALHRQLSRLFDEGSQADGEDASDADLRSAALGEVRTAWRSGAEKLSAVPTRGAAAESAEEEEAYSPVELSTEVYKAMMLDARAFGASLSAVAQVCHAVADCVCNYGKSSLPVGLGQIIVKQARVMLAQFWTLRKSATLVMSSTMEVRARRRVLRDRKEFASTVTHTLEESLHELHESVASYEGGKRELARREAALKGWELETQALLIEAKHDVEAQIAESSRLVAGLREKLDAALKEVKEEQRKVVIAQQCKPTLDWYRNRAEELEKELAATKLRVAALEHKLSIQ